MDVQFFLTERTRFIRRFFETAAGPFREIIRKIEAEEEPYVPEPSEDGEPPFLAEWMEAETSLQTLGQACLSMLSASLQVYFQTWESELHIEWAPGEKKRHFEHGFVPGYRHCFGDALNLDWRQCPADFDLLEQITLARNASQHHRQITNLRHIHDRKTRERFPLPFFASEREIQMLSPGDALGDWFAPSIHVSQEKLLTAINMVEEFVAWLEPHMLAAKYGAR